MKEVIPFYLKSQTEYPGLTDVSKAMNELLGDTTGRTVSRRTAHGFRRVFNTPDMHEDKAEGIVHGGMITTVVLLKSKDEGAKLLGLLLLLGLGALYLEGKEEPIYF
jgi:hypothetical protein